jgi:translation initiation factor IF-2
VNLKSGEKITFLDTPGHAAFSAMRMRGANATDIVVLVVAADDGVMPQTIEAISHAKAAGAPIIVAVNKIDKHEADPNRVLNQLLQYDVQVESMGGETQVVQVSALKKLGLEDLTNAISVQAELMELSANPTRSADGVVIESQLDKGRGSVATILVQRGTLKRGDIVVAGSQWGKVKALVNERGQALDDAPPSTPVEILGLDGTPDPGDPFVVVESEARAREITDYRLRTRRNKSTGGGARASLEQMLTRIKEGGAAGIATQEASFIIKGDVQGSVEAITQSLEKLSTEEVRARIVLGAAGGISESDVQLAITAGTPIIAFNVRANKQARDLAEREGVEIRYYSVIYDLINDVKDTLSGMLAPERRETFLGYANILQVFNISKVGKVAGCRISEGIVKRGCGVRLLRDNVVIHEGTLSTLKRFKDEVPEVKQGMECGMAFTNYTDIREGDQIECFQVELIQRRLE